MTAQQGGRAKIPAHWPGEKLEADMSAVPADTDAGCHVRALLGRVRELERALRATGYFQTPADRTPECAAKKDYFPDWLEGVEYVEGVDALLDDYHVPCVRGGQTLWLRERVELVAEKARARSDLAYKLFRVAFDDIAAGLRNGDWPDLKPLWDEARKEFEIP